MPASLPAAQNRIFPALVTPLSHDGELDEASRQRLIDHLYQSGCGGLYVLGSTGEGIYLSFAVRRRMAELAVAASRGRGQAIVHVGAVQAGEAFELAAHAARVGADAVSSIPPFVGGYSWDEVLDYYRQLCQAGPLPVVGYYIPGLTGRFASLDELSRVAELPGVGGFKYTGYDLYQMQRLLGRLRPEQVLFNGADEMLSLGLALGAHGGIGTTYNFMPRLVLEVYRLCAAGRLAEAVEVQKRMNEVIEVVLSLQGLAATKQILYWQGLIASPHCAPPRAMLSPAQQADLRRRLEPTAIGETLVQ